MKRVEWADHVAAWKRSGETADTYGKPYKIRGKRLQWWNWFLKSEVRAGRTPIAREKSSPTAPMELLPVRIRPSSPNLDIHKAWHHETAPVEVIVPSGSVIRTTTSVDPGWLGKLIIAARG